ncbi:MAG: hypothetical protein HY912_00845 [Desulfomonile tiedjei]|uniref:Uncharacterized protein n=1 Tax=Desulfomonile tiedjei TaxID=2358 RepID=A0A9D6UY12_9BACT|nr:hypothetical protein [Desulfomonile tiedjei]
MATNDGSVTTTDVISIDVAPAVTPQNIAPVNHVPTTTQAATLGSTLGFYYTTNNNISVSDADAGSNLETVTLSATNGTINLAQSLITESGITFSVGDGIADQTMTFSGTVSQVNIALGWVGFNGTSTGAASLSVATNDGTVTTTDVIDINVA